MNDSTKPDAAEHVKESKLKEVEGNVPMASTKYQSIDNDGIKNALRQVSV